MIFFIVRFYLSRWVIPPGFRPDKAKLKYKRQLGFVNQVNYLVIGFKKKRP